MMKSLFLGKRSPNKYTLFGVSVFVGPNLAFQLFFAFMVLTQQIHPFIILQAASSGLLYVFEYAWVVYGPGGKVLFEHLRTIYPWRLSEGGLFIVISIGVYSIGGIFAVVSCSLVIVFLKTRNGLSALSAGIFGVFGTLGCFSIFLLRDVQNSANASILLWMLAMAALGFICGAVCFALAVLESDQSENMPSDFQK